MDSDTGRLGLWIPHELHARVKAHARSLNESEQRHVELRELYGRAFRRLADRIDAGEAVDFRVDRRDRVRVSLALPSELLARMEVQRRRLKLLGTDYAVAAIADLLAGTTHIDRVPTQPGRSPRRGETAPTHLNPVSD